MHPATGLGVACKPELTHTQRVLHERFLGSEHCHALHDRLGVEDHIVHGVAKLLQRGKPLTQIADGLLLVLDSRTFQTLSSAPCAAHQLSKPWLSKRFCEASRLCSSIPDAGLEARSWFCRNLSSRFARGSTGRANMGEGKPSTCCIGQCISVYREALDKVSTGTKVDT